MRSAAPDALPLMLAHGRPGSIVEFLDVIGPLSADFHPVIPSVHSGLRLLRPHPAADGIFTGSPGPGPS